MDETVLAHEVLLNIFFHLSLDDLKNVRLSCKQWREVSLLDPIGTNQRVCFKNCKLEDICNELKILTEMGLPIEHLKLCAVNTSWSNSKPFWAHFGASIETLVFESGCAFTTSGAFREILRACPNLTVLRLSGFKKDSNLKLKRAQVKLGLKELSIVNCCDLHSYLVAIFWDLCTSLVKFQFSPYGYNCDPPRRVEEISSDQLMVLFTQASHTLSEIDITFDQTSSYLAVNFDDLFSIPGLTLRKVHISKHWCFTVVQDALLDHQGDNLRELCITDSASDANAQLVLYDTEYCRSFSNLRKIRIPKSQISEENKLNLLIQLVHLLENVVPSNLAEVEISGLVLLRREEGEEQFSLHYAHFTNEWNVYLVYILTLLRNPLNKLTELSLTNVSLSHDDMVNTIFRNAISMRKLFLSGCSLTDDMLMSKVTADEKGNGSHFLMMNLTRLQELTIENENLLTDESLSQVIKFPKLHNLTLQHCPNISGPRFPLLGVNNPNLKTVRLYDIGLTDSVIDEFVGNSPNLVFLNIRGNPPFSGRAFYQISQHPHLKCVKC